MSAKWPDTGLPYESTENHLKIVSICTLKPTLEDAFIQLTGLRPEIMAIEKEQLKPKRG